MRAGENRWSGLKVLILGPLGPPHVSGQALALQARGVDVHVGGNLSSLDELEDSVLESHGIPVHTSPSGSRSTPWGMAATVRWTKKIVGEVKPDVVQAHWVPGFGFAAAAAGVKPLATTAWGSDIYRPRKVQGSASRFALKRSGLVMADSQDLLDACVGLGADPANTALVQWGVDLKMFTVATDRAEVKRRLGLGEGPLILSPRSLMAVYNIPKIIEAFGEIGDRFPDAQLILKHMGAQRIELGEMPHADRVKLIGKVDYEEMADYYRAADACVSLTSSDSSPRSIWEAMACGAPCVLSDLPWVHEMIEPGRDALTVQIDPGELAESVCRLLTDSELSERLTANGRSLVERNLDHEAEMDGLADRLGELAFRE